MAGYDTARDVIWTYFQNNFKRPDTTPWFKVEYPNHTDLISDDDKTGKPWGRFTLKHGRSFAREAGSGKTRTPGVAYLQIFMPENTGLTIGYQAGDQLVAAFENTQLLTDDGIIRFREVAVRELDNEDGWGRVNVELPFVRDANRPAPTAAVPYTPP